MLVMLPWFVVRLSEHTWKPRLEGYNFLKKMDEEAAKKVPETGEGALMREMNEHGLSMLLVYY